MYSYDINRLPGYKEDEAAINLAWDFCLTSRIGGAMEGQKRTLAFLALWRSRRDDLLDLKFLLGVVNSHG